MRREFEESEASVVLADDIPIVILPDDVDIDTDFLADPEDDLEEELLDERVLEEVEDEISLEEAGYEGGLFAVRMYNVMGWVVLVSLTTLFMGGWSYYLLPVIKRPFHHLHEVFRSSGAVGLPMGIVGTLLIVVSLICLLRKHFVSWTWLGPGLDLCEVGWDSTSLQASLGRP
jgi:hypothetical protein